MAANIKDLVPELKTKLAMFQRACVAAKLDIIVTQGFRSIAEQNALYAQGRTTKGAIVTNAKGGQSQHNFGKAFDICFLTNKKASYNGPWETVGKLGEKCGLEWGGRWKQLVDKPHFQIK